MPSAPPAWHYIVPIKDVHKFSGSNTAVVIQYLYFVSESYFRVINHLRTDLFYLQTINAITDVITFTLTNSLYISGMIKTL